MGSDDAVLVRSYRSSDRETVRRIACDTADRGAPVERLYYDREVMADMLTRYYTDFEPDASWVAECDGRVSGYLSAAFNHRRYVWIMRWIVMPTAIFRTVWRGAPRRREFWRLLAMAPHNRGALSRRHELCARYPAHLHVNVVRECRGRGVGKRLVEALMRRAGQIGIAGVCAPVRDDNPGARAFFERMGFKSIGGYVMRLSVDGAQRDLPVTVYGKTFEIPNSATA